MRIIIRMRVVRNEYYRNMKHENEKGGTGYVSDDQAVAAVMVVIPDSTLNLIRTLRLRSKGSRRKNRLRLKRRDSRRNSLPVRRGRLPRKRKSVSVYL